MIAWNKAGHHSAIDEERIARDKKNGMQMLAAAVLKQWYEDGKPDDIPTEWVLVLKSLLYETRQNIRQGSVSPEIKRLH